MTTQSPSTIRDLNAELLLQLTQHWVSQLRPRLEGLTDEEYRWEPVAGCWNLRPRGSSTAPVTAGSGAYLLDFAFAEPEPAPMTTIAWQIGHLLVGIFGDRLARHFGGPAVDYPTYDYPEHAADAISRLDAMQAAWVDGVRSLGEDGLGEPCNEPGFETSSMAALVLHIHREVIHHGSTISTLRDLYTWRL